MFDKPARGEHEDRSVDFCVPELAANLDSAQTGQTDVQQDTVVCRRRRHFNGFLARLREVHSIGILTKRPADETRHAALVFNDQDSHRGHYMASLDAAGAG